MIFYTSLWWLGQNMNVSLNHKRHPIAHPNGRVSYRVSFVMISYDIDHVTMVPRCICISYLYPSLRWLKYVLAKDENNLSSMVNNKTTNGLVMLGARPSESILLNQLSWNIPILALEVLVSVIRPPLGSLNEASMLIGWRAHYHIKYQLVLCFIAVVLSTVIGSMCRICFISLGCFSSTWATV